VLIGQTYIDRNSINQRLFALGSYLLVKGAHTYISLEGLIPKVEGRNRYTLTDLGYRMALSSRNDTNGSSRRLSTAGAR
jgi:hypothetical protein